MLHSISCACNSFVTVAVWHYSQRLILCVLIWLTQKCERLLVSVPAYISVISYDYDYEKNALYIIQLCTFQRTLWNVVLFVNYFSSFTAIQFCLTSWHLYYLIDKYFSLFVFPSQVFLDFTTTIAVFSGSKYKTDLVVFLL